MPNISTVRRAGRIIGFQADIGQGVDGKRQRKFLKNYKDAEEWIRQQTNVVISEREINEQKDEILVALKRMKKVNAKLLEAVDFFIKHQAIRGNPKLTDVAAECLKQKQEEKCRKRYVEALSDRWEKFAKYLGEETLVQDITKKQIWEYIYVENKGLSKYTQSDYVRSIKMLFRYAVKQRYLGLDQSEDIKSPSVGGEEPKVLRPEEMQILLNRCVRHKWYDRMMVFVMTGFCGIRTEEACKLRWEHVNLEERTIKVPAGIAKKGKWRGNNIPENAFEWIKLAIDGRQTKEIIQGNARQKINNAIRRAYIGYTQNCLRHSFVSYSIASGKQVEEVAMAIGHAASLRTLHNHYRNAVTPADAKKWWAVVPPNDWSNAPIKGDVGITEEVE